MADLPRVCDHCGALPPPSDPGGPPAPLKICSACRVRRYCSADCQRGAWPGHRAECKEAVAALAQVAVDRAAASTRLVLEKAAADALPPGPAAAAAAVAAATAAYPLRPPSAPPPGPPSPSGRERKFAKRAAGLVRALEASLAQGDPLYIARDVSAVGYCVVQLHGAGQGGEGRAQSDASLMCAALLDAGVTAPLVEGLRRATERRPVAALGPGRRPGSSRGGRSAGAPSPSSAYESLELIGGSCVSALDTLASYTSPFVYGAALSLAGAQGPCVRLLKAYTELPTRNGQEFYALSAATSVLYAQTKDPAITREVVAAGLVPILCKAIRLGLKESADVAARASARANGRASPEADERWASSPLALLFRVARHGGATAALAISRDGMLPTLLELAASEDAQYAAPAGNVLADLVSTPAAAAGILPGLTDAVCRRDLLPGVTGHLCVVIKDTVCQAMRLTRLMGSVGLLPAPLRADVPACDARVVPRALELLGGGADSDLQVREYALGQGDRGSVNSTEKVHRAGSVKLTEALISLSPPGDWLCRAWVTATRALVTECDMKKKTDDRLHRPPGRRRCRRRPGTNVGCALYARSRGPLRRRHPPRDPGAGEADGAPRGRRDGAPRGALFAGQAGAAGACRSRGGRGRHPVHGALGTRPPDRRGPGRYGRIQGLAGG